MQKLIFHCSMTFLQPLLPVINGFWPATNPLTALSINTANTDPLHRFHRLVVLACPVWSGQADNDCDKPRGDSTFSSNNTTYSLRYYWYFVQHRLCIHIAVVLLRDFWLASVLHYMILEVLMQPLQSVILLLAGFHSLIIPSSPVWACRPSPFQRTALQLATTWSAAFVALIFDCCTLLSHKKVACAGHKGRQAWQIITQLVC